MERLIAIIHGSSMQNHGHTHARQSFDVTHGSFSIQNSQGDNHFGVPHGSFSIQNLKVGIAYLHLAHSCQMPQTKAIDNFEHNLSLYNCLCFGNSAEKLHADNLLRHGHGLCRIDKNT